MNPHFTAPQIRFRYALNVNHKFRVYDNEQVADEAALLQQSDYHPGLDSWKPIEEALRTACMSDGPFSPFILINSLRGILSWQDVNSLHHLRMTRNDLVHNGNVSLISQSAAGATTKQFTNECARLTRRLSQLSTSERRRAHNALASLLQPQVPGQNIPQLPPTHAPRQTEDRDLETEPPGPEENGSTRLSFFPRLLGRHPVLIPTLVAGTMFLVTLVGCSNVDPK